MEKQITQEITDRIIMVSNGYVSLYLIRTTGGYIAIDAGQSNKLVRREFKSLRISPEEVRAVFLTHSDTDHVAGLPLFSRAEVYLAAAEEQMINGRTKRFFFLRNKLPLPCKLLRDDDQKQVADVTVRAILTPGHTPGSMSYLVDGKYLFPGDCLALKGGVVAPFTRLFNMDTPTQTASIRKLAALPEVAAVFTAHHGYTLDTHRAFAPWRQQEA